MFRKLHKTIGIVFTPFFLLTAVTGIMLLFRKTEVYGKETKDLLIGLHNWEIGVKYIGIVLAIGLLFTVASGFGLLVQSRIKRRRVS